MQRRDLLALLGLSAAVTGVGGLAAYHVFDDEARSPPRSSHAAGALDGRPSTRTAQRSNDVGAEVDFDETVDAVGDLGMDPNGSEPIDDALDETAGRSVLVEFPPGDYLFTRSHALEDVTRWGVRGLGSSPTDVRFVPPRGEGYYMFNVESGRDILVENVSFHMRGGPKEWVGNVFHVADNLQLRDVRYTGFWPDENHAVAPEGGDPTLLKLNTTDPDGGILVDSLVRKGPAHLPDYPEGGQGLFAGPGSKGTIVVRDSHFENMPMHGIYASRTEGPVQVEETTFENVNGNMCRVAGEESWVKNCRFVVDVANDHPDNQTTGSEGTYPAGNNGVWCESGFQTKVGPLVEGCEFVARSADRSRGLLEVDGSVGATVVRDCTFTNDVDDVPFVNVNEVGPDGSRVRLEGSMPPEPRSVAVEGVTCTGSSSGSDGVIDIEGRNGSAVTDCAVDVGGNRDGVVLRRSHGSVVSEPTVDLDGRGVALAVEKQFGTVLDGGRLSTGGYPLVLEAGGWSRGCYLSVGAAPTLAWKNDFLRDLVTTLDVRTQTDGVETRSVSESGCVLPADGSQATFVVVDITEAELSVAQLP
jgi:hypothetical protein